MHANQPKASVIIAVYKDTQALRCILHGLEKQTEKNFEIIVAEDGEFAELTQYLSTQKDTTRPIIHLTQTDQGFRKTRAVNRGVATAHAPYVIFLDGDCIPHPQFVALHLAHAEKGRICTGRKVNLGPKASLWLRHAPSRIDLLINKFTFFLLAIPLHLDHIRNFETGLGGKLFHHFAKNRGLGIMGCNFSCFSEDMLKINGYNEDLPGIGGEDDDLEWRFNGLSVFTKNIKFLVPVYHLYHDSRRQDYEINARIMQENKAKQQYVCVNGLHQHLKSPA
jgi:glycosyltransferase involved in cell wall biosynthesis